MAVVMTGFQIVRVPKKGKSETLSAVFSVKAAAEQFLEMAKTTLPRPEEITLREIIGSDGL